MRSIISAATVFLIGTSTLISQEATKRSTADVSSGDGLVVMSGPAVTAKVADPNSLIVFGGVVMRVADFVSMVSSSTEAVQRLHTQETRSHETTQRVPPSPPSN